MAGARRPPASALCKSPIGSVDPYALKISARRAECLFTHYAPSLDSAAANMAYDLTAGDVIYDTTA
jgi:hypothetical protein